MTAVAMFPGQGAQRKGMGGDLFDRFPELTDRAAEVLGYSVRRLCLEDPHGELDQTRYTQPAMYVVNALAYRGWLAEHGPPDAALGHSLGEFNALEAAGAFGFEPGLRLVAERAALMADITGGMSAVVGFSPSRMRFLLARIGIDSVDVANLNTPWQSVLAGPVGELAELEPILEGAGARMVRRLPVSGPFHSRYMAPAARRFASLLSTVDFGPPRFPVVSNRTAAPYGAGELATTLSEQIDHPVRWHESVSALDGDGVEFVEIGTGTTLVSMVRQIRRETRREAEAE